MTITEVSKKYDISADTIRYYEKIGLIPPINRNKNGVRNFTEEDCKWIEFAKCMRNAGLSIDALSEYLVLFQKGNDTIKERKQLLIEQRNELAKKIELMQNTLKRLDSKIDGYEEQFIKKEEELKIEATDE